MIRRTRQIILRAPRGMTTEAAARMFWQQYGQRFRFRGIWPPTKNTTEDQEPADAYINESRWVADCSCGGGIAADPDIPVGCCLDCGHIRPIRFPDPEDREAIERTLRARPRERNRNWRPGEPPGLLQAENLSHGVGRGRGY